jgi:hypothetical protein
MPIHHDIFDAIGERDYLAGYTMEQLLCRQATKLQEELGEVAGNLDMPGAWAINHAASIARKHFDDKGRGWQRCEVVNLPSLMQEMADLMVVLRVMQATVERITNQPFDLDAAALTKAQGDIGRGVR